MTAIKKIIKQILFFLVLSIGMYLLAALVLSLLKTHPPEYDCKASSTVYVSSNGIHLDIIVSLKSLDKQLAQQLHLPQGTKWVAFGWGDKNFYINTPEWKDLTVPTAFKALFLKSESAMHVTAYKLPRQHWKNTTICPEQEQVLLQFIVNSFQQDANGELVLINVRGYGPNDRFYNARGSFSLFKTCNVWTNTALKKAGIPTSLWSPFDFGVLYHFGE